MNRLRFIIAVTSLTTLVMAAAIPLYAGSMGTSRGYDLDQLWIAAQKHFDTSQHDAVVLLESSHVSVLANGNTRTSVHRVVWIGTARGIRENADLRIPYNSATSTLTVTVLRTWRDDIWWPSETEVSPTAVVETVPNSVALADDYTMMRETMLLHDGVELPCIMETVYEIEQRGSAEDGIDGTWVFPQRDPAGLATFAITVPANRHLKTRSQNGAPEPEVTRDADQGVTHKWTMTNVDPLGTPRIPHPAGYAPHVSWSTWSDWESLGRRVVSTFDEAAVLDDALADTIAARVKHEPTTASKARKIVSFVEEGTRSIHYDSRHWTFSPRPASRTWETAYGHGLDRAVLAAALFRQAGLDAEPMFRSSGPAGIDPEVPGLDRFGEIGVWVTEDGLRAFYDPVEGTLTDGPRPLHGRLVWKPRTESRPPAQPQEISSRFELIVTLVPGEDQQMWTGTGVLRAEGLFSPHGEMTGLGGEALALVDRIASSALPGAAVKSYNPEVFQRDQVTVGFELVLEAPKPDDQGRTSIRMGNPAGGATTELLSDVFLYQERRSSPVVLPGKMAQRIRIRLKTGGREIVYLPVQRELSNGVGRYVVSAGEKDGWVTVDRTLEVRTATVPPEAWTDLRALLLEATDSAGRTVLMK